MNDYKATIRGILAMFIQATDAEHPHATGKPYDDATASLLKLLTEATVEAENVLWYNDTYLIMQTADVGGEFTPDGLYQIYERQGDTDNWERYPTGGTSRGIIWYKTLQGAIEAAEALSNNNGSGNTTSPMPSDLGEGKEK